MPTLSSPSSSPSSSSSIFYLMPEIEPRTSCLSAKHSATEAHYLQPLVSRTMKQWQMYSVVSVAEWIAVTLG